MRRSLVLVGLLGLALLTSCGGGGSPSARPQTPQPGLPEVPGPDSDLTVNPPSTTLTTLTLDPVSVREDGGTQRVKVTATIAPGVTLARDEVVYISLLYGSAEGEDFTPETFFNPSKRLTIAAGEESGEIFLDFTPVNDNLVEGSETLIVNGTGNALATGLAILTIVDDDSTP